MGLSSFMCTEISVPDIKIVFQFVICSEKAVPKSVIPKTNRNAFFPAGISLLKVNNRNTRARCEICPKLTIRTPERCLLIPQDKTYPQ